MDYEKAYVDLGLDFTRGTISIPQDELPAPLVLVVDDDDRARHLAKTAFADRHCAVVEVSGADDAVWEMRSSPGIDLLFTDVKLHGDVDDDTSGMRLGDYLKRIRPDIPVALYSTRFYEEELDEALDASARERFDIVLPRGGREWKDASALNECVNLAFKYRDRRFAAAATRQAHSSDAELEIMREFVVGGTPGRASNEMLKNTGYTLRLLDVRHGELRGPVAVWVLEHGRRVSAELYQCSKIHSVGDTVDEALEKLAQLLHSGLDIFKSGERALAPNPDGIPWLMLQHASEWERLADDIESRD